MPRLTTRDYKRPSRDLRAAKLREFGLGVLVGAVLASAAFMIAGAHARHEAAAAASSHPRSAARSQRAPSDASPADGTSSNSSDATPAPGSASPSAAAAQQTPHYDFYRMLPSFKVPVPHDDERASPPPPPAALPTVTATAGAVYFLQVGSYHSTAEADQVRARLARIGIAAQVQRTVDGSRTWNRVRIGPLGEAELQRVREQLRTANIHALVIRADR